MFVACDDESGQPRRLPDLIPALNAFKRSEREGENTMPQMPLWIKPVLWGAVAGSVVTMIIGFNYGGWTTSGTSARLAKAQADTAVTTALVPICVAKSKGDRAVVTKMGELKALTSSYDQRDFVTKTGWATVPGSDSPNSDVAEACAAALLKTASN
jgi:hypothetical protein